MKLRDFEKHLSGLRYVSKDGRWTLIRLDRRSPVAIYDEHVGEAAGPVKHRQTIPSAVKWIDRTLAQAVVAARLEKEAAAAARAAAATKGEG